MEIISSTVLICYLLYSPFMYAAVGGGILSVLCRHEGSLKETRLENLPLRIVLGLFASLLLILLVKCLGAPWWLASSVPMVLSFWKSGQFYDRFVSYRPNLSLNFVLWFFVVLCLGVSLFDYFTEISTSWVNNYGDLTFHLGMISRFVFGDVFPPDYYIYAGKSLTYPFLINLWSAAFWWMAPSWSNLQFIFVFQWVFLWTLVYALLRGNRYPLLPWLLLLGGGTLMTFGEGGKAYSWEQLNNGYPWTVFLTTIWVTQRTALLGLVGLLAAVRCYYSNVRSEEEGLREDGTLVAGTIVGMMPLVHMHFFLVAGMALSFSWGTLQLRRLFVGQRSSWREYVRLIIPFAIALPAILFLMEKKGMVGLMYGWTVPYPPNPEPLLQIAKSIEMWQENAALLGASFVLWYILSNRHMLALLVVVLFFAGNVVRLSTWEWDQLKYFLALYAFVACLWSLEEKRRFVWAQLFLVLLIFPGVREGFRLFIEGPRFVVFNKEQIDQAVVIRQKTSPESILASKPDHNAVSVLTGRRMFAGYAGTLSSHNMDYGERERTLKDLDKLFQCRTILHTEKENCPDYLVWTNVEPGYFGKSSPLNAHYVATEHPFLFEIRE